MKQIRIFDLKITDKKEVEIYKKTFEKFLKKGIFFLGPEVEKLEKKLSKFLDIKHIICLSSGSSGLYLALKALDIKKGDEVITTPLSWIITANAIIETGAKPVFADIDENLNIDVKSIKKMINKKTKAIVPMHYGGKICDMEQIKKIGNDKKIYVVEDAAQSFGSSLNGKKSGSFSDISSFSLNPMKPLGGIAEGGFCATNSLKYYKKLKQLRYAGTKSNPIKNFITNNINKPSLNHKMSSLNAIFVMKKLEKFNIDLQIRNKISNFYIKNIKNVDHIKIPTNETSGRYIFTFKTKKRDQLLKYLIKMKIQAKIYHLPLITKIAFYKKYKKDNLIKSSQLVKQIISIPCHSKLEKKEVIKIVKTINRFYEKN